MPDIAVITGRKVVIRIVNEITCLRADQRKWFIEWLMAHCAIAFCDTNNNDLENCLEAWFESLPDDKVLDELLLLLTEVSWWRKKSAEEICRMNTNSCV